jgi:hypothetical protein
MYWLDELRDLMKAEWPDAENGVLIERLTGLPTSCWNLNKV